MSASDGARTPMEEVLTHALQRRNELLVRAWSYVRQVTPVAHDPKQHGRDTRTG
jgi:hypothetical protein